MRSAISLPEIIIQMVAIRLAGSILSKGAIVGGELAINSFNVRMLEDPGMPRSFGILDLKGRLRISFHLWRISAMALQAWPITQDWV